MDGRMDGWLGDITSIIGRRQFVNTEKPFTHTMIPKHEHVGTNGAWTKK